MTPEEKINLAIKSIQVLQLLYGDKLENLLKKEKDVLATVIVDAHRELIETKATVIEEDKTEKQLMLPVEEIVSFYSVEIPSQIKQRRIKVISNEVLNRWRQKYNYSIGRTPLTHYESNTYGYFPIDFHLVREVLIDYNYL